jgi:hypothetical protein
MPVTRDLSAGKRQAVLAWLAQFTGEQPPAGRPPEAPPPQVSAAATPAPVVAAPDFDPVPEEVIRKMLADVGDGFDGKTHAMRDYLQSQLSRRTGENS